MKIVNWSFYPFRVCWEVILAVTHKLHKKTCIEQGNPLTFPFALRYSLLEKQKYLANVANTNLNKIKVRVDLFIDLTVLWMDYSRWSAYSLYFYMR